MVRLPVTCAERSLLANTFLLFCFEMFSTGADPVVEITDNPGIYFKHEGSALHHISDENLIVSVDTRPIRECIERLEQLNQRIAHLVSNSAASFAYDSSQFQRNIDKLKTNFQMIPYLVDRKRARRRATPQSADLPSRPANAVAVAFQSFLQTIQINFKRLEDAVKNYRRFVRQTQLLSVANRFLQLQEQVESRVTELQNAVLFARRNVIHPSVLSPSSLLNFTSSRTRPSDIRFPLDNTLKSMAVYAGICAVSTDFVDQQVVFTVAIPLVSGTLYDVYSLLAFPKASTDGHFHFIQPTDNYLLINVTTSQFAYLHSLDGCTPITNSSRICRSLRMRTTLQADCEAAMLAKLNRTCALREYDGKPDIWYPLDDHQWAFVQPPDSQIAVTYSNGTSATLRLPTNGILNLDSLSSTNVSTVFRRHIDHRLQQSTSAPQLASIATFSDLLSAFNSSAADNVDSSTFDHVIEQIRQDLKPLHQFLKAVADRQADSAQIAALETRQRDQLRRLDSLQSFVNATGDRRTSKNGSQSNVNLLLIAAIITLAIFECVLGFLLWRERRHRRTRASRVPPLELGIKDVDTCRTQ